ncbi:MAG: hypothetical protein EOO38_06200 [Cytophagaceae bacterium]|nr:MAG: hypothetical protein EOO38_06200 [Cytophagaceae bacterium]
MKSTYTGTISNSRMDAFRYGFLVNEVWGQRLLFQVLDSSTKIGIGIGIKNQGVANSINVWRDMYAGVEGTINDSTTTKLFNYQFSSQTGSAYQSTQGVLIHARDYIELTLTQTQDTCVLYFRNLTSGAVLKVVRKINPLLSGSSSRMGYAAIFLKEGHYRLIEHTISRPADFEYVFLGNSTTWGHSVDSIQKSWVNRLRQLTDARINNMSKSAGCTYVLTMKAAQHVAKVIAAAPALCPGASHDWIIYAICRSQGLNWFRDPAAGIMYRQHASNLYGARRGWADVIAKFRMTRSGWYREHILWLKHVIIGRVDEKRVLDAIERGGVGNHWWLIIHASQFRRTPRSVLQLRAALLSGAI